MDGLEADLWANLAIRSPGPYTAELRALATWRRRGRLPQGVSRNLEAWTSVRGWLFVPRGLLPVVRRRVPGLRVRDRRLVRPALDWRWRGNLFDYQTNALQVLRRTEGGTLIAPPGAGKTETGLGFAAILRQPALWLVTSLDLADQTLARARRLFDLGDGAFGLIDQDNRTMGTHLTVATVDTLARYPGLTKQIGARVGTVIGDEAHHLPALSFLKVLRYCPGRYRLGLTATPDRGDGLGPVIPALTGPETEIAVSTLVAAHRLMLPAIRVVYTGFGGTPRNGWGTFQQLRAESPSRNALVVRIASREARRGRRVLVVVELVAHAATLARLLRAAGVPCSSLDGAESRERRAMLLQAFRRRPGTALVATKLADEGLDLPEVDCLVLVTPGRSSLRLRQQVGRVMRVCVGKRSSIVYDLADTGAPSLWLQLRERLHTYRHFGDVDLQPRRIKEDWAHAPGA